MRLGVDDYNQHEYREPTEILFQLLHYLLPSRVKAVAFASALPPDEAVMTTIEM